MHRDEGLNGGKGEQDAALSGAWRQKIRGDLAFDALLEGEAQRHAE
jgi:hypothetical protein